MKIISIILGIIVIGVLISLTITQKTIAESFDPEDEREIGYEFLDDNKVVHIWNTQDDYFFEKDAGIQLTNHYEDYWTRNIFCIGYYNNDEWNKIVCSDELDNFNKNIHTDNLTYVNATLWKDITYEGYDLRLGIGYHLGVNDTTLAITIYAKNIGIDIPFDLGFAWKVTDVNIPGLDEDYIDINGTSYALNGTYDLLFKNMNESYFNIHDLSKYLRLDWDNSLNYAVKLYGDGNQSNFYTATFINAGHFNPQQEKSTTLYWIDADTSVVNNAGIELDESGSLWGPYWLNESVGAILYFNDPIDIKIAYTINAGVTWTSGFGERLDGASSVEQIAAWYDKETPGNTGTLIHVAWLDQADDVAYYRTVDLNNNFAQGTLRTIVSGLTVNTAATENKIAITQTLSGNLIVALLTQVEVLSFKSDDGGATWESIATGYKDKYHDDYFLLYPANTGDDNDAAGLYWRNDKNIIIRMYDDSENDWTDTLIVADMYFDIDYRNIDGVVRHSDNHILMAAHSYDDNIADDLLTWDLTVDSIDSPTITQKTEIFTNQDHSRAVSIIINQQNNDIYLAYSKGETTPTESDIIFYKSEDGMDSWGDEVAYSETADDNRLVSGGRSIDNNGGRIQWSWHNDDTNYIFVNSVNDIEIEAVTLGDSCDTNAWDCTENCDVEPFDAGGNVITADGDGVITIAGHITNCNYGGDLLVASGGCQVINSGGYQVC